MTTWIMLPSAGWGTGPPTSSLRGWAGGSIRLAAPRFMNVPGGKVPLKGWPGGKNAQRQIGRYNPVGRINDFADLQVHSSPAEAIGLLACHVMLAGKVVDDIADGLLDRKSTRLNSSHI